MKKIISIFLTLAIFCGIIIGGGGIIKAMELNETYTMINEDNPNEKVEIFFHEENCDIIMTTVENGTESKIFTYEVIDAAKNVVKINPGGAEELTIVLDDENKTFKEYVVTYPCNIIYNEDTPHGDLIYDIEGGNVGEIVTVRAKPYALCKLVSISVNGIALAPDEVGNYQFALVNGENKLVAVFEYDQEEVKAVYELLEKAKEGKWEDIFTLDNLFNLIAWSISALTSGGFLITLLKNKKIKAKTANELSAAILEVIPNAIDKYLGDKISPIITQLESKSISTAQIVQTMSKCMVLAQENTPTSRLAIIEELTKIQKSDADIAAQVKAVIAKEVENAQNIINEKKKAISELEKANETVGETTKEESVGRI